VPRGAEQADIAPETAMTKSLDLKRDDPRSHPFDTTAPSISRRALDHADLLSGDYWGELRTFLWVAKAGSLSKAAELLGSSHATSRP
jgi:hypothetical protein